MMYELQEQQEIKKSEQAYLEEIILKKAQRVDSLEKEKDDLEQEIQVIKSNLESEINEKYLKIDRII